MFEALTKGFRNARNKLQGLTELTEANLEPVLRDVRLSLLEADVELGVVKSFLAKVKAEAIGQTGQAAAEIHGRKVKIGPAERFIKICQDELEALMRFDGEPIELTKKPQITGIMVVGLQGSGKTTSAAKLARYLEREKGRKVLLVAADIQRPGAIEQLRVLAERVDVPLYTIPGGRPLDICKKAIDEAKKLKRDTIIYDTAGRLAVDEPLMNELVEIRDSVQPQNVFLVVDAMIGQDAVRTAQAFHERVGLSGVIMTKLDGDARGGAALSIKQVTGTSIKFVGVGENVDKLEQFRADGMASRILGFGDIVGLMKDFEQVVDEKKAEADAKRMLEGQFSLDDFLEQIRMIQKMGSLRDIFDKLPMFDGVAPGDMNLDDGELKRVESIVSSMTRQERQQVDLFQKHPTRIARVAKGSGQDRQKVVELLERFVMMRRMMGDIGQQAGMLQKIPGMKQLAMARRLKDAVKTGGLENPMMAGLAEQLLEAVVADGGQGGGGHGRLVKPADKSKKKAARKAQRQARKKSRR